MASRVLEAIVSLSGHLDPDLQRSLDAASRKLDGFSATAAGVAKRVSIATAAIGTAVIGASGYLVKIGDDYNKTLNDIRAKTGATQAEMEGLDEAVKNIYKSNRGESFEDIGAALSAVMQVTEQSGDALESTTMAALTLRDTFDYDVAESARAAKAMMQNFGVSGEEAMSMIAAGAQNGLDYSGELIDSISEYSVQFAKVGLDANDMFQIFQAGADSGAWNLDKVGDAIKEFSIRSIDGSKTSAEAYEAIGLNAKKMTATFAKGGEDAEAAFQKTIKVLMEMEDPVARDAAGVGLFGTMWEDLGVEAMQALADTEGGIYDTKNALEQINQVKYSDLGSAMQAIKRNIEVALLPAATEAANAFTEIAPKIGAMVETSLPYITQLAGAIAPVAAAVFDFAFRGMQYLGDNINWILPLLGSLTAAIGMYKLAVLSAKIANMGGTAAILAGVRAKILDKAETAYLGALYAKDAVVKGISTAATIAHTVAATAATVATTALGAAVAFLTSPIGIVILAIGALIGIGILLYKNWDVVKEKAAQLGAFLYGVWESVKEKVSGLIESVKSKFSEGFQSLTGIVTEPLEKVLSVVTGITDKIKGVLSGLTGGVKNVASAVADKATGLWDKVTSVKAYAAGGFTDGVSIAGEAGTEAIISFDPKYRSHNIKYWQKAGQLLGVNNNSVSLAAQTGRALGDETADYSIFGGAPNTTNIELGGVEFAPQITINGDASKQDIMDAIEAEYPEFIDLLERWFTDRGRFVYAD